eukprot:1289780-Pleurochrysis_carterae.AAC.1
MVKCMSPLCNTVNIPSRYSRPRPRLLMRPRTPQPRSSTCAARFVSWVIGKQAQRPCTLTTRAPWSCQRLGARVSGRATSIAKT